MKSLNTLIHNPFIAIPAMLVFAVVVALSSLYFLDRQIAKNPPRNWLNNHNTSRQIKAQTAPIAQIVVSTDRLSSNYIPTNIIMEPGGDGVVLRGPRDVIYAFHRKIYYLDENEHGLFGFKWRTE